MATWEDTHPWITFTLNPAEVPATTWMLVGEAKSKCDHLAHVPLAPVFAERLHRLTLIRGALATTAIEGNTITEEQAVAIVEQGVELPPSRAYQEAELRNMVAAYEQINASLVGGTRPAISAAQIKSLHRAVTTGTGTEHNVPGEFRRHQVTVGSVYRGVPHECIDGLVDRMCTWLSGPEFRPNPGDPPEMAFARAFIQATAAHIYTAWIHPFGDGNGRTARLLEYLLLASAEVPFAAAYLLANHFNLTRDRYYDELRRASRDKTIVHFIGYAIQGFVDGLRGLIDEVRDHQMHIAWTSYSSEQLSRTISGPTLGRVRSVLLAMEPRRTYTRAELEGLTVDTVRAYTGKHERALTRDMTRLVEAGLVARDGKGWRTRYEIMEAFLPPRFDSGADT